MLKYSFYVSSCCIAAHRRTEEIDRIVKEARASNALSGITGALIFSEARFAQYMEGPEETIDDLLIRIGEDSRHEHVTILQEGKTPYRLFGEWSLSYAGPSLYIDRHIKALVGSSEKLPGRQRQVEQLMRLMLSLTKAIQSGRRPAPQHLASL